MSHHPERKEKNCLNCGTIVQGRYCHQCGQENIEPKETFWHLASHFFYDITHFDGKLFHSVRYLVVKPGFLANEYLLGRRASYLNPVRMYVFVSAFFFLLFFSFLHGETEVMQTTTNGKSLEEIDDMDSTTFAAFTADINKNDDKPAVPMTRAGFAHYIDSVRGFAGFHFTDTRYSSRAQYDSMLASGKKKHNWFMRQLIYKEIELNARYHNDSRQVTRAFGATFTHNIPQVLFISLPLLALLLKLLYIRRKAFYYVNHAIFAIYLYIFMFLGMLAITILSKTNNTLHWGLVSWLELLCVLGIFVYEYIAMYRFYGQSRFKTLVKFILLNILFFIMIGVLFALLVIFSFFKI